MAACKTYCAVNAAVTAEVQAFQVEDWPCQHRLYIVYTVVRRNLRKVDKLDLYMVHKGQPAALVTAKQA